MELEGHPTHDIVEELERRGAIRSTGSDAGPDPASSAEGIKKGQRGVWLFLPPAAYNTEIDEPPAI